MAVLASGLLLSQKAPRKTVVAGQHIAAAVVSRGCGATWIRGITENKTGMPMGVASTGERLGNKCAVSPRTCVRTRRTRG